MRTSSIKIWFDVHVWTSLISTAFLLMLCVTGLPLIFDEEIEDLIGKELHATAVPPGAPRYSKDAVLEEAMKEIPGKEAKYIFWDEKEHPGQMFVTLADSSEAPIEAD